MCKKCFIFVCIAFLFTNYLFGKNTKVLFIGNSYTYFNDLPLIFKNISNSLGENVEVDWSVEAGTSLKSHFLNNTLTTLKIKESKWDYIVLQDFSQRPSMPDSVFKNESFPYWTKLDSLIKVYNPRARTVLYMTWGRKYGDFQFCSKYPYTCTFEGMNAQVRKNYIFAADSLKALLVPAGVTWKQLRDSDSTIELYNQDKTHPSFIGSYLNACVFYATIFNKSPLGSNEVYELSSELAFKLQSLASQVVLDSTEKWMLLRASFDTISLTNDTILFENEAKYASNVYFNLDDNFEGSGNIIKHKFSKPGIYNIKNVTKFKNNYDTLQEKIQIGGNYKLKLDYNKLYLNSKNNKLVISAEIQNKLFENETFSWKSSDSTIGKITTNGLLSPLSDGIVTITCIANNYKNLTKSLVVTILGEGVIVNIEDCFSPKLDDSHFYPNPTSETLHFGSFNDCYFIIIDIKGNVVYINEKKDGIDHVNLNKGVYFVIVFENNKSFKVLVE